MTTFHSSAPGFGPLVYHSAYDVEFLNLLPIPQEVLKVGFAVLVWIRHPQVVGICSSKDLPYSPIAILLLFQHPHRVSNPGAKRNHEMGKPCESPGSGAPGSICPQCRHNDLGVC